MKRLALVLFGLVLFYSCGKEPLPLSGDFLPLVGEWKYIGRIVYEGSQVYIEPYGIKHSVIFKEEGTYEVIHDGGKKEKGKIVSYSQDKYGQYIALVPKKFTSKIYLKDSYSLFFYSSTPEKIRISGEFKINKEKEYASLIYERQ